MTARESDRATRIVFLELACPYARILAIVVGILVAFTVITSLSVLALSPPNPTYYISLITTAMNVTVILAVAALLYFCRQWNLRVA